MPNTQKDVARHTAAKSRSFILLYTLVATAQCTTIVKRISHTKALEPDQGNLIPRGSRVLAVQCVDMYQIKPNLAFEDNLITCAVQYVHTRYVRVKVCSRIMRKSGLLYTMK